MKLNLLESNLREGFAVRRFGRKADDLATAAALNNAITTRNPILLDGRRIGVVVPVAFTLQEGDKQKLTFRPIWCRGFRVHDARTKELKAIYVELESGKYEVTANAVTPKHFTSCGPGVSEQASVAAEIEAKSLLDTMPGNPIVQKLARFLSDSLKPSASTAAA